MKKLRVLLIATALGLAFTGAAFAQALDDKKTDNKTEWASKVVALQQGPQIERLVAQLANGSVGELIANWQPKLQALPQERKEQASAELTTELKKYAEDVSRFVSQKIGPISTEVLVPAYAERFSVEELKQLASFLDSDVVRKYQSVSPEIATSFLQKLVDAARPEVLARAREFDTVAAKIIGAGPTAAPSLPAKAGKSSKK